MISYNDMIALLEIKDAYDAIAQSISNILGDCASDSGSPMSELEKIYDIIADRSPLYNVGRSRGINYSDSDFFDVVHSDLPNEEKARKLLMLDKDSDEKCDEEEKTPALPSHKNSGRPTIWISSSDGRALARRARRRRFDTCPTHQ